MKKSGTKRALTLSALSIVLCLAMLVGTTFAWFTDSVSTGVNRIVAGNLDVELYYKTGNMPEYQSVKGAGENPFFRDAVGNEIKWEPGAMAYTCFKVTNEGSLALKYALTSVVAGCNNLDGHDLSEVIKFAVIPGDAAITGREDAILSSLTYADFDTFKTENSLAAKTAEGVSSDTFTVVAYWEPGASDNLYNVNNGARVSDIEDNPDNTLWLNIEVNLKATQDTVENDSFGNDYDMNAWIEMKMTDNHNGTYSDDEDNLYVKSSGAYVPVTSTETTGVYEGENGTKYISNEIVDADLKTTLAAGGSVELIQNLSYSGSVTRTSDMLMLIDNTNLDLDNNTMSITSKNGRDGILFDADYATGTEATISNGTITQDKTYGSSYAVVTASETTITLNNVTVIAQSGGFAIRSSGYTGTKIVLNNCTVQGGTTKSAGSVIVGSKGELEINNSKIIGLIYCANNSKVTITDGDFTEATFYNGGTTYYTVTGGTFSEAVATATATTEKVKLANGYNWQNNGDGTYTVVPAE